MGGESCAVGGAAKLPAARADLVWQVSKEEGPAGILQARVGEPAGAIEPSTDEPAAPKLVVRGNVVAEGLCHLRHPGARPDKLGSADEGAVNRPSQGLPPQGSIDAVKLVRGVGGGAV